MSDDLVRRSLHRAAGLAGAGLLLLLLGGTHFPPFALGMGLIAWGMVPYRRLVRLRDHPDRLLIEEDQIFYIRRGRRLYQIERSDILRSSHEKGALLLWLKDGGPPLRFPHFPEATLHQPLARGQTGECRASG